MAQDTRGRAVPASPPCRQPPPPPTPPRPGSSRGCGCSSRRRSSSARRSSPRCSSRRSSRSRASSSGWSGDALLRGRGEGGDLGADPDGRGRLRDPPADGEGDRRDRGGDGRDGPRGRRLVGPAVRPFHRQEVGLPDALHPLRADPQPGRADRRGAPAPEQEGRGVRRGRSRLPLDRFGPRGDRDGERHEPPEPSREGQDAARARAGAGDPEVAPPRATARRAGDGDRGAERRLLRGEGRLVRLPRAAVGPPRPRHRRRVGEGGARGARDVEPAGRAPCGRPARRGRGAPRGPARQARARPRRGAAST